MAATLKSRLPQIAAELRPRVNEAVEAGAEIIAERARARVPDAPPQGQGLIAAIHVEDAGSSGYSVLAGDAEVFYGHMVEFGTSHSAAHPFLIPAAEESREAVAGLVTAALRRL